MLENDVLMEKSIVQIQQEEASEEYIKRFSTKLKEMICRGKFDRSCCRDISI